MNLQHWPIEKLKAWEKNPRSITEKGLSRLKKQLKKLKQYKSLLVTPDGTVLGGNMRLRAMQELGIKKVWVSIVEPKDENEMLEYALSDNDRSGKYDENKLEPFFKTHKIEWADFSVDLKEPINLKDLSDRFMVIEEDEVPEVPEEAISKYGEVYQLGRHRLMCGDSTKIEDVEKLMDGKKADMVFTDPPYNIGFDYRDYKDNKSKEDYLEFCKTWFGILKDISTGTIAITCGLWNIGEWYLIERPSWTLAWIKMNGMSRTTLGGMNKWEPVLLWRPKMDRDIDVIDATTDRIAGLGDEHPAPKPVKLIATLVKRFSDEENSVLDVFGGSGSTLIACEQINRTCYMMELDPKYCDVIKKRYENYKEKNG